MTVSELGAIITAIVTAINTLMLAYMAIKRLKPEIKKVESEADKLASEIESELADAAKGTVEGAKISIELLLQRVAELKLELDQEKAARKKDIDYLRRRVMEAEKDARDYRLWAAKLAKQVIEAGKAPIPFEPSPSDSQDIFTATNNPHRRIDDDKPKINKSP